MLSNYGAGRGSWAARRSNQSILKEINPEYSLARLMIKLKLQYFGHFVQRTDSLEKTQMLGKIEGRRRRGGWHPDWGWDGWMASLTQWTWIWASSRRQWRTGEPGVLQSMGSQGQTWLSDRTATDWWWGTTRSRGFQVWLFHLLSFKCQPWSKMSGSQLTECACPASLKT